MDAFLKEIDYDNNIHKIGVSFIDFNEINYDNSELSKMLSMKEYLELQTMKFEKRKHDYVLGRLCSKIAVQQIYPELNYSQIDVSNGFFNQPVVNIPNNSIQISLSHCNDYGIAIAFDESIPMGIDIEEIKERNYKVIKSQLTQGEMNIIDEDENPWLFTAFWALKEAISKALKTGFLTPIEVYEISEYKIDENMLTCEFKNFPQFASTAYVTENYVTAVVFPNRIENEFGIDFFKNLKTLC